MVTIKKPVEVKGQGTKARIRMGKGTLRAEEAILRRPALTIDGPYTTISPNPTLPTAADSLSPSSPTADSQWNTALQKLTSQALEDQHSRT